MRFNKNPWPLSTFKAYERQINPKPLYQRDYVWKDEQKRLLMDSIIRRIDLPKIYLREVDGKQAEFRYEIIDGKQRMSAIWDFLSDQFLLPADSEPVTLDLGDVHEIAGKKYSELHADIQIERIHNYSIDAVIISQAGEEDIADLFYRLNHGSPLSNAEIRNSLTGAMSKEVSILSEHKFFSKVSFSNRRYSFQQIVAQLLYIEIHKGPVELKDKYLNKMYIENKVSVNKSWISDAKKILDQLNKIFPAKSKLLKKVQVINLYTLLSYLIHNKRVKQDSFGSIYDWYMRTEPRRLRNREYIDAIQSSVNAKDKILQRFQILLLDYNEEFKDSSIALDPKRIFDDNTKIQIYSKGGGVCQNPNCGKKISEDSWHADHILPWIKGGKTDLSNGQALCIKCNLSKKDALW